tara:strand:- start:101 stop:466 length:366 start_codon:yes stop_codon:yes gene_type:complete
MRGWLIIGAILAALSVIFGAFGAHWLKSKISSEDLVIFEIGVRYQMYHAFALIILGILGFYFSHEVIKFPGYFFCSGILIFSGSLYLLVITNLRWLGAITPIGGFCFILGWVILAFNIYKS